MPRFTYFCTLVSNTFFTSLRRNYTGAPIYYFLNQPTQASTYVASIYPILDPYSPETRPHNPCSPSRRMALQGDDPPTKLTAFPSLRGRPWRDRLAWSWGSASPAVICRPRPHHVRVVGRSHTGTVISAQQACGVQLTWKIGL